MLVLSNLKASVSIPSSLVLSYIPSQVKEITIPSVLKGIGGISVESVIEKSRIFLDLSIPSITLKGSFMSGELKSDPFAGKGMLHMSIEGVSRYIPVDIEGTLELSGSRRFSGEVHIPIESLITILKDYLQHLMNNQKSSDLYAGRHWWDITGTVYAIHEQKINVEYAPVELFILRNFRELVTLAMATACVAEQYTEYTCAYFNEGIISIPVSFDM